MAVKSGSGKPNVVAHHAVLCDLQLAGAEDTAQLSRRILKKSSREIALHICMTRPLFVGLQTLNIYMKRRS